MVCKKINAGIREYLESQHLGNIEELVGTLRTGKEVSAAPTL
jgi:dihydroorotate dehydrogenase